MKRLPKYFKIAALCCIIGQALTYYLPMVLNVEGMHVLSSALDDAIPLVPGFVFIYVAAFLMWIYLYFRAFLDSRTLAYRLMTADLLCKAVCLSAFLLYPCTLIQPSLEGMRGFGAWALHIVYTCDRPINLLPSMHCYMSCLCVRPLLSGYLPGIKKPQRVFFCIFAFLICLSTLFTKQHVMIDVVTGVALSEICWQIAVRIVRK